MGKEEKKLHYCQLLPYRLLKANWTESCSNGYRPCHNYVLPSSPHSSTVTLISSWTINTTISKMQNGGMKFMWLNDSWKKRYFVQYIPWGFPAKLDWESVFLTYLATSAQLLTQLPLAEKLLTCFQEGPVSNPISTPSIYTEMFLYFLPSPLKWRNISNQAKAASFYIKKTPWLESASELYRPSDHRLSVKWLPTLADRGCHVVSVTNPYGRILGFLDRRRYFLFK
jgi:hypothetical protein